MLPLCCHTQILYQAAGGLGVSPSNPLMFGRVACQSAQYPSVRVGSSFLRASILPQVNSPLIKDWSHYAVSQIERRPIEFP
jgi:hypothetical protein